MEQLETTKGKSVVVPKIVERFIVMAYHETLGWQCEINVYTTPESAIEDFLTRRAKYQNNPIKYYKVVAVELEIPFVGEKQN